MWAFYLCLNVFVVYNNYKQGMRYVGNSFRTCFEESYCFGLIELLNRNFGPTSNIACSMFYGRWYKNAGLAGAERTLRFLDETRDSVPGRRRRRGRLSRLVRYFSPVSVCFYLVCLYFYVSVAPPVIVVLYWMNTMGQVAIYMLVFIQYYVFERGFARVNDLVETVTVVRPPRSARLSLVRLSDTYSELCTLVDHVNRAYAPDMLLQWVYNIIRIIMVVFRLLEIASSLNGPLVSPTSYLVVEHLGELFIFVLHTSCTCTIGERLSSQVSNAFVREPMK